MSLAYEDTPRDPLDAFEPEHLIAKVIALGYEVRAQNRKNKAIKRRQGLEVRAIGQCAAHFYSGDASL